MKRTKILFIYPINLVLVYSCVTSYQPDIPASDTRILVVEGQITDEVGPFRVKLSNTFDVDAMQQYGEPVSTANVQIFDDQGNLYQLNYISEGWYETEDTLLQGVPGNTYTLNITTDDGTQYESTPVLMQEVPSIDSVYFEEVTKTRFENGEAIDENWLDIFVDAHDPSGQTNYWKWDFEETWEVDTPKDSVHININPEDGPSYTIAVNLEFEKGNVQRGWDNKKERCWVTKPSASILIESTNSQSVDEILHYAINSIAPDIDKLHIKYSILVKQYALSKEMYNYWQKLKEFNEETGGMYDRIPQQVFANIVCCDGQSKALGYFWVSAVKTKRIFISSHDIQVKTKNAYDECGYFYPDKSKILYYFGTVTEVSNPKYKSFIGLEYWFGSEWCVDCRVYGTNKKPDFWEE